MKNKFVTEGAANILKKSTVNKEHVKCKDHSKAEKLEATSIVKTIKDEIWNELSNIIAFGIIINESTDITITKHLDIYISYYEKIISKLVVFASDSVSVMLGKNGGVVARLSRVCTYSLIINYYVMYRLALVYKDVRKEIEFYKEAELLVKKIYGYFKNSCSCI
ncbi:hypothetical protein C1645_840092 [Glomus cerebriforme]|uniref:DUF659 domain-containing protein n=1 Tax=Glomus cerebriforme TaxID=658196 RepID=A0A397S4Q6_9GLOM|nr:hypothetical protein C1645_840092 [Glomus cerebriforme]